MGLTLKIHSSNLNLHLSLSEPPISSLFSVKPENRYIITFKASLEYRQIKIQHFALEKGPRKFELPKSQDQIKTYRLCSFSFNQNELC